MKKMNMIWTKIAALALGAVMALGIGATVSSVSPMSEAEAATTQTERRVYALLEQSWGDGTFKVYVHHNSATSPVIWGTNPAMERALTDYYEGLYFYDVPIDATEIIFLAWTGETESSGKQSDRSVTVTISNLFNSNYKAVRIGSWVADANKRTITEHDTLPSNSGQAAGVLNHINSCSTSYAGGYNAWPQLNDLFITPSTLNGATVVSDNFGDETTIDAKTAYLEARYNADQASSAQNVLAPIDDKNRITITVLFSIIGLSLVGGLYFYSRKKQSSI